MTRSCLTSYSRPCLFIPKLSTLATKPNPPLFFFSFSLPPLVVVHAHVPCCVLKSSSVVFHEIVPRFLDLIHKGKPLFVCLRLSPPGLHLPPTFIDHSLRPLTDHSPQRIFTIVEVHRLWEPTFPRHDVPPFPFLIQPLSWFYLFHLVDPHRSVLLQLRIAINKRNNDNNSY